MSSGVFVIQPDNKLVELNESNYDSEVVLQKLLADYPNLLSGSQIDPDNPRRWLLISREMSIPLEESPSNFFVDHLFLDQDAVPTLVEVKRSSDLRIRREIIGQMLDYAANASQNWPLETIIAKFEAYCESHEIDPAGTLDDFLGDDISSDEFWQMAATNLRDGKLRLLFVADEIPIELQRVVEFLNEQMTKTEVLAVEIKQYTGHDLKTLVPRVIGQTAETQRSKRGPRQKKKWSEALFFPELERRISPDAVQITRKILEWAQLKVTRIYWGEGIRDGSFVPILNYNEVDYQLFPVWTYGRIEIYFQHYLPKKPFDDESKREELREKLNEIDGLDIPREAMTKRPSFDITLLDNEQKLTQFFDAFEWFIQEVEAT